MCKKVFLFLFVLCSCFVVNAQFSISNGLTADSLARILSGSGVVITNPSLNCGTGGSGRFDNAPASLGFSSGVILTNGLADDAIGTWQNAGAPATDPTQGADASTDVFGSTTDATLAAIASGTTYDDCVLDFNIRVLGDTLEFNYVFSSEEYIDYVCAGVNDLFGFFISGPNPAGGNYTDLNIARIPGTTTPVSINTINNGIAAGGGGVGCILTNTTYYNGPLTEIEYDGNTVKLTAKISTVPCQTYTLKLAIADVGDGIFDSGVFLQESSFTSNVASIEATSSVSPSLNYAVEGCVDGVFNLTLPEALLSNLTVNYQILGSATNGTDYTTIPTSITFPAGSTSQSIVIDVTDDGIAEGVEELKIVIFPPCGNIPHDSATLLIYDEVPFSVTPTEDTICLGQTVNAVATGAASYSWWPATGISSTSSGSVIIFPSPIDTHFVEHTLGTCVDTASVYVKVGLVNVTLFDTAITCGGVNNGSIGALGVSNVSENFTYQWSTGPNDTLSTITGLGPGTYTLTVTDEIGCSRSESVTLVTADSLEMGYSIDSVACFGDDGGITLTLLTENTDYNVTYTIGATVNGPTQYTSNASGEIDFVGLSAGSYLFEIEDLAGNCNDSVTIVISDVAELMIGLSPTDVLCNGDSSGSIDATISGGTLPYSYLWTNGDTIEDITGLTIGLYCLIVTDANGCVDSACVNIQEADPLNIEMDSINVNCFGDSTGVANPTVTGGTTPYTFLWNDGSTTEDLDSLSVGTYCVAVMDAYGCTDSACVNITQSDSIEVSLVADSSSCLANDALAYITNVTGGIAPYIYEWEDASTNDTLFNIGPGWYTVTIRDDSLCTVVDSVEVFGPPQLVLDKDSINVSCFGESDGEAEVIFISGSQPLTYDWSNMTSVNPAQNLVEGVYTVEVTDLENCIDTLTFNIEAPDSMLVDVIDSFDVLCFGENSGYAFATPLGGTAPYTYEWNDDANTINDTVFNLSIGVYTVTITDSNNCVAMDSVMVNQPDTLIVSVIDSFDVSCFGEDDGYVFAEGMGGMAPYTYEWNDAASTMNDTAFNLIAGTYTVTITDVNGCVAIDSVVINQPDTLIVSVIDSFDVSCFGEDDGYVFAEGLGGTAPYNYEWNDVASTMNDTAFNLIAGTYTVTITDVNGCIAIDSVVINQPDTLIVSVIDSFDVSCFGEDDGYVFAEGLDGTAPYNYEWNDVASTMNDTAFNLIAETYTVTITDVNGCIAIDSVVVNQPDTLIVSVIDNFDALCFGDNSGYALAEGMGGTVPYNYEWNDVASTMNDTAFNLIAGTYTVTITDVNGCIAIDSVVVNQPDSLVFVVSNVIDIACFGDSTGVVATATNGGTSPYSYMWSDASNNDSLINVPIGTYTSVVTDFNGCQDSLSVTIAENPILEIQFGFDTTSCSYDDGRAYLDTITGGVSPYTFSWLDPVSTMDTLENLEPGWYLLEATDDLGCTMIDSVEVLPPALFIKDSMNVSCYNDNDAWAMVVSVFGTPPYTYTWSTGDVGVDSIGGLTAGIYGVVVTNSEGCSDSAIFILTQPDSLEVALSQDSVSCFGGNDGSISSAVVGGTAPFSYQWNDANSQVTDTAFNLSVGFYTLIISDAHTCMVIDSIPVLEPDSVILVVDSIQNELCNGDSIGAIFTSISGGTSPYSFSWNSGQNTPDITNLSIGSYILTMTDANDCEYTLDTVITEPAALGITMGADSVLCFSDSTGLVYANVSGGVTPYTYVWDDVDMQSNDTAFNLPIGVYTVLVTDSNNCTITDSVEVFEPMPLTLTLSERDVFCNGDSTGYTSVNGNGGTAPYTYLWNDTDAQTTDTAFNLPTGMYTVIVTDANGCITTDSIFVGEPTALQLTLASDSIQCFGMNNGTAWATVQGGVDSLGFYQYLWDDAAVQTTDTAFNLLTGVYTVLVTDSNNCTIIDSIEVFEPDTLEILVDSILHVGCNGNATGEIFTTTTGGTLGYTYTWTNTAQVTGDITGLTANTYEVTVTDANNCTDTVSAEITEPMALTIATSMDSISCFGGNDGVVYINVGGGTMPYTYLWDDAGASTTDTVSGLLAGIYTVVATDSNGCMITDSIEVLQPDSILLAFEINDPTCFGFADGFAVVNVTSGGTPTYTFTWSNMQVNDTVIGLSAGMYTVVVEDGHGCLDSNSLIVGEPTALNIDTMIADSVLCFGTNTGTAHLVSSGGTMPYTYLWDDAAVQTTDTAFNLLTGVYTVLVTDSNNCTIIDSIEVFEPDTLEILVDSILHVGCNGNATGEIFTTTTGGTLGYTYTWTNTAQVTGDITGLTANTYEVTVTDANNCTDTVSAEITEPMALTIATSMDSISCFGGNDGVVYINVGGGTMPYTYLWDDAGASTTDTVSGLLAGIYTVVATDSNGCTIVDNIAVQQPDALVINFIDVEDVTCFGLSDGTATASISGGTMPYSYNWDSGENMQTANQLDSNMHIVIITDMNNCVFTDSILISQPEVLQVAIVDSSAVSCFNISDGSATVSALGGTMPYTYQWDNTANSTSATPDDLDIGLNTVIVFDENNCSNTTSVLISGPTPVVIDSVIVDSVSCYGENDATLQVFASGGTAPYIYALDVNQFQNSTIFYGLSQGSYTVYINDDIGCFADTLVVEVEEPEEFTVAVNPNEVTIGLTESVPLDLIINFPYDLSDVSTIEWVPSTGLDCDDCSNPIATPNLPFNEYTVTVENEGGCIALATVIINVDNNLELFIPSAFTPNGDGTNETLLVFGEGLKSIKLQIFNRWGEKLFESNNQTEGWDGTYKGVMQQSGVYTYYFEGVYLDEKIVTLKGSLTLLR